MMWPFKRKQPPILPMEELIHEGKRLLVKIRRKDYSFRELEDFAASGLILSGLHQSHDGRDYPFSYIFTKTDSRIAREAERASVSEKWRTDKP